jgi:hypothetical protein
VAEHRRLADGGVIVADEIPAAEPRNGKPERVASRDIRDVRSSDIEPYTGLRYLSKLFRFMAVILLLLLVAEVATGVYTQGSASIPTLLGEASRLIVLAGVLWGTGDLAHLLIDVGHDVRAARILVARVAHAARVAPLSAPRTADQTIADRISSHKNFAAPLDNSDEGPPIP